MIFHRLEAVTHAVEKGEWPAQRRYYPGVHDIMSDSQSSTPLGGTPVGGTPSGTPRGEPSGHENYNLLTSSDGMVRVLKSWPHGGLTESEAEDSVGGYYGNDEFYPSQHGESSAAGAERLDFSHERAFRVALTEVGRRACMGVGGGRGATGGLLWVVSRDPVFSRYLFWFKLTAAVV